MTRSSILEELVNLGPSGVPLAEALSCPATYAPLLGIPAEAVIATVQRMEPPRPVEPLVWAVAEGRTILFRVDDATFREMQAALAAGERPTAIVEPCQIVSIDL